MKELTLICDAKLMIFKIRWHRMNNFCYKKNHRSVDSANVLVIIRDRTMK